MFPTADVIMFHQNTCKTGNSAVKMSLAFQDIAWFKRFTGLNLLEYVFNAIQNWDNRCFTILFDIAYFLLEVMAEGDESSWLRMAN